MLQNYTHVSHTIIDKYERLPGVVNEDVVDLDPSAQFDLVLAVSTLEHVGWDEAELDPRKVCLAFERLIACVAPGGRLWVSVPRGYHRYLDRFVDQGAISFSETTFMRRVSRRRWRQVGHDEVKGLPYGVWYGGAAALMIGIIDKPATKKVPSDPERPPRSSSRPAQPSAPKAAGNR